MHRKIQHMARYTDLSPTRFKDFGGLTREDGDGAK
jgi:hypothetical protein